MVAEYNTAGTMLRRFVHGAAEGADDPLVWFEGASVADSARRYLYADEQGSIQTVTDASGNVIAVNRYDEYGIPATGNLGRFQYTGQAWINELGMYYYKARIYSPTLGRFMQTDPIGYEDQFNLYAYVGNDPINLTDPSGQCTGTLFCGRLAQSGREDELIQPWRGGITEDRASDIEKQVGFSEKGPSEQSVALNMPIQDIPDAIDARADAFTETALEYPTSKSTRNNEADAFRHANVAIRLDRSLGGSGAKDLLDAHERGVAAPRGERLMDLVNNHNARVLSRAFPKMSPRELAREALKAGLLQTQPYRIVK